MVACTPSMSGSGSVKHPSSFAAGNEVLFAQALFAPRHAFKVLGLAQPGASATLGTRSWVAVTGRLGV